MKSKKRLITESANKLQLLRARTKRANEIVADKSAKKSDKLNEMATEIMLMEQILEDLKDIYSSEDTTL
jgi:hypothetical protein